MRRPPALAATLLLFAACTPVVHGVVAAGSLPAPKLDVERADEPGEARVVLAGGCFWCTEVAFEQIEGVTNVVSGYAGGTKEDANYEAVGAGRTDHAEAIEVTYDPSVRTLGELLSVFFTAHDPTELNRQGPDVGRQYRSAIFHAGDEEKKIAEAYIKQLDDAGAFDEKIATTLEPLEAFYPAEAYHQDFVRRNPEHPYVLRWSVPKAMKVKKSYPDWIKKAE